MKRIVAGIFAHVDAGKTTLAESMMLECGAIRSAGRVDHGDSHLDTDELERRRGITIFASQANLEYNNTSIVLLDSPGHVDFCAEAERVMQVLDYAILVIDAHEGIKGHTETIWALLNAYRIPTFVFFNKMDLCLETKESLVSNCSIQLESCFVDSDLIGVSEDVASVDEASLAEYFEDGEVKHATLQRLIAERKVFPCFFGSALRGEGTIQLLRGIDDYSVQKALSDEFSARVFKVTHDSRHERLTWMRVLGGSLKAKDLVFFDGGSQKVEQIRVYAGSKYESVACVEAGMVCTVTGLSEIRPGSGIGEQAGNRDSALVPTLEYRVVVQDADINEAYRAICELADEDPLLAVTWNAESKEIRVSLMGPIQLEVIREIMKARFGLEIDFGPGSILYKETIATQSVGIGHFEPLRHYAEAHLLLEPLERGSGVQFGTRCNTDDLDLNWQRLILTNAMERDHMGVLTGSPITDVRISLISGKAHLKHTMGGDFRQATYRAIRQALMKAESILLEPWYSFSLRVPSECVGRALSDLQRKHAEFEPPSTSRDVACIKGVIPVSEVGDYPVVLAGYSAGRGSLSCTFSGYRRCHNSDEVIRLAEYDPCSDLTNTPDSVFCSHGAGYTVKWDEVDESAHVKDEPSRLKPFIPADGVFFGKA